MARKPKSPKYYMVVKAELGSIIEDINYRVSTVIVEGPNDEDALRNAGLKSPVVQFCSSGVPVFAFVDDMVGDYKGLTVLVLLDFDEEGAKMAERLERELEERGVRVERFLRRRIGRILAKEGIFRLEEIDTIKSKAEF